MVRPAERFAVNIVRDEPVLPLSRRRAWSSLPDTDRPCRRAGCRHRRHAAIDLGSARRHRGSGRGCRPDRDRARRWAVGVAGGRAMAPDRRFYAPVLLDRIPVDDADRASRNADAAHLERCRSALRWRRRERHGRGGRDRRSAVTRLGPVQLPGRIARGRHLGAGRRRAGPTGGRLGRRRAAAADPTLTARLSRAASTPMFARCKPAR